HRPRSAQATPAGSQRHAELTFERRLSLAVPAAAAGGETLAARAQPRRQALPRPVARRAGVALQAALRRSAAGSTQQQNRQREQRRAHRTPTLASRAPWRLGCAAAFRPRALPPETAPGRVLCDATQ